MRKWRKHELIKSDRKTFKKKTRTHKKKQKRMIKRQRERERYLFKEAEKDGLSKNNYQSLSI